MTTRLTQHYGTEETPQTVPVPGKPMKANSAGGYAFEVDDWSRLDRFLILGTENGSYYASERKLTVENAEVVRRCLRADGARTLQRIVSISQEGRAPKNDQAVFALAMCLKLGDEQTRRAARAAVPSVCRIGTHIFQLAEVVKAFGGWGRNTKGAIRAWHEGQDPDRLAMNLVKYQNRNGWTHKDLLRRSHASFAMEGAGEDDLAKDALFRWVVCNGDLSKRTILRYKHGADGASCRVAKEHYEQTGEIIAPLRKVAVYPELSRENLPPIVQGFEEMRKAESADEVVKLIQKYGLPRETVPTQFLSSVEVWEALLRSGRGMPFTAMIRNLGKMSEVKLISKDSSASKYIQERLSDEEGLKRARVHPIAILLAQAVYGGGRGIRGSLEWNVDQSIVDALNDAFYKAFKFVEPTGQRFLLGLDVSGSMDSGSVAGTPLTPREAAGAMALVTAKTEEKHEFIGYSHKPVPIHISPSMRLDAVCEKMRAIEMGGTDAALPMLWATARRIPVDVFISYTDNETYAGRVHPFQALKKYRQEMGIPAKLIVVAFTANDVSIADPDDGGMMDVVGFDASAPEVMANFVRG